MDQHQRGSMIGDPWARLTLREAASRLDVSEDDIIARERNGELFSVCLPESGPERLYVAFQFIPSLMGRVMQQCIAELGTSDSTAAYAFFMGRCHELGQSMPAELLCGRARNARELTADALDLLALPAEDRLGYVLAAARAFRADSSGW